MKPPASIQPGDFSTAHVLMRRYELRASMKTLEILSNCVRHLRVTMQVVELLLGKCTVNGCLYCFQNPYFRMYLPLLARACEAQWLTTEDIESHIKEVCVGRIRLTDHIDWEQVSAGINLRE